MPIGLLLNKIGGGPDGAFGSDRLWGRAGLRLITFRLLLINRSSSDSATTELAIVNRAISGNRILLDGPKQAPAWGQYGLTRFDDGVLGTAGATHLVIAFNSNDWGLPGRTTSMEEMPTVEQLIAGYQELIDRAETAGLTVILATVTPLGPHLRTDPHREELRQKLNHWIRTSDHEHVDFDAAIRSPADPTRLQAQYAAPDDTHPNINGSKRLAQTMIDALARLKL